MSAIDLTTLLQLVGRLSDSDAPDSASGRFRSYIRENVCSVSELREYVETALSTTGEQYRWALQDPHHYGGRLMICIGGLVPQSHVTGTASKDSK